jgi:2,5-diketo-D-gluconate reductase A
MITLNNGVQIPQLGFGVYQIAPDETKSATLQAFEVGYRHIDTAEMYRNERGVGEAVRESGIPREEIFVTSKLNNSFHAPDAALRAFDETLHTLDIDYLDLFLIHRLLDHTDHVPSINQIEAHPYLTQDDVRAFDFDNEIATEAWSPIARGKVLGDPELVAIAERLDRSPAQVTLRWHIQRGDIVFPKSVKRERMVENFTIFDFTLTPEDMAAISALNRDERTGPDPDTNNWIPS